MSTEENVAKLYRHIHTSAPVRVGIRAETVKEVSCYVSYQMYHVPRWRRGAAVERRTRDQEVAGSSLGRALWRKNSGQVSHT